MSLCWQEKLRTMGPLFCYLIILQILCCTLVSSEFSNNVMRNEFVQSPNSVLQAVWRKEPFIFCNIPKPPDNALENKIFLTFSFDQFLCVILYDISSRYAHVQPIEPSGFNSENIVQSIIENSPLPQNFCQEMRDNVWSTNFEENSKWFQKFNNVMNNLTSCNKYCVADVVNPLCAYILWLDSSLKVKLHEKLSALTEGHKSQPLLQNPAFKLGSYDLKLQKLRDNKIESPKILGSLKGTQKDFHDLPSNSQESHFLPHPTAVLSLVTEKSSTKKNINIDRSGSHPYLLVNQSTKTVSDIKSSQTSHDSKTKDSHVQNPPSSNNSPIQLNEVNHHHDVVAATSGLKSSKPIIPAQTEENLPIGNEGKHQLSPGVKEQPFLQEDENTFSDAPRSEKKGMASSAVTDTAASNNALLVEISTDKNDEMVDKSDQYNRKDVQPQITTNDNKNGEVGENRSSENTPKSEFSKTDTTIPGAKQTSSGTDLNKKDNKKLPETNPPKHNLELENGNAADEGISDGVGAIEHGNHENPKAMDEAEGRDDVESVAENPEDPSEIMDVASPTHFGGDNDSPLLKPNTSPKISEYADEMSDEDPALPMNEDREKGTQNDADAGIYVHDRFVDAEDSHFFAYFMTMIVLCILGYLIFHNKQKILALALEGRVRKGNRRRPSTSGYRKLDSNLEEAVTSNCSGASVTHVIY